MVDGQDYCRCLLQPRAGGGSEVRVQGSGHLPRGEQGAVVWLFSVILGEQVQLAVTNECQFYCDSVHVGSVACRYIVQRLTTINTMDCRDGEWTGEPELGFWCYNQPEQYYDGKTGPTLLEPTSKLQTVPRAGGPTAPTATSSGTTAGTTSTTGASARPSAGRRGETSSGGRSRESRMLYRLYCAAFTLRRKTVSWRRYRTSGPGPALPM